jgi:uncharacterized membrane protein
MKNLKIALISVCGFALFAAIHFSCDKKVGKSVIPTVPTNPETISACDTITYSKHIKPIIARSCASVPQCHTTGFESGGINLDLMADVKAYASQIKQTVFSGNPKVMPPVDDTVTISVDAKKLLNCWLNNGMKP